MEAIRDRPLFSRYYDGHRAFAPVRESVFIFAGSVEERSTLPEAWVREHAANGVHFYQITEQRPEDSVFLVRRISASDYADAPISVSLKSRRQLSEFLGSLPFKRVYLDVTGQDQATWAGLLRACLTHRLETMVVYVEPQEYSYSTAPVEGEIFDLSERIRGLEPVAGFASFKGIVDDSLFIPTLGFEGPRFQYVVEQLQPESDSIFPIVGVPGFRPEYPFYSYWCNKTTLLSTRSWRQVRFARANCPFSLFHTVAEITQKHPGRPVRIAAIGTKPHALGAVLFVLANASSGDSVELVYDHPIRKAKRTSGTSTVAVYYISSFLPAL